MPVDPVSGDVDTATYPHLVMGLDMVEELLERTEPGGTSKQAAMHTD
jgi:hypothetical protein